VILENRLEGIPVSKLNLSHPAACGNESEHEGGHQSLEVPYSARTSEVPGCGDRMVQIPAVLAGGSKVILGCHAECRDGNIPDDGAARIRDCPRNLSRPLSNR
jgi:hypothetical protein